MAAGPLDVYSGVPYVSCLCCATPMWGLSGSWGSCMWEHRLAQADAERAFVYFALLPKGSEFFIDFSTTPKLSHVAAAGGALGAKPWKLNPQP